MTLLYGVLDCLKNVTMKVYSLITLNDTSLKLYYRNVVFKIYFYDLKCTASEGKGQENLNNILSSFEGVYTKNRNFRLYKSSKLGKNAAFCVAEDNTFLPKPPKHTTKEEYIFLASLITNIRLFVCIFTSLCKHVVHTMVEPAFL